MTRIQELRKDMGISMREAAKRLSMPYTTYVNYEKGLREPNIEVIGLLAQFFHVSIDYLLGHVSEPYFHLDNKRILRELSSNGEDDVYDDAEKEIATVFRESGADIHSPIVQSLIKSLVQIPEEGWEKVLEFTEFLAEKHKKETDSTD